MGYAESRELDASLKALSRKLVMALLDATVVHSGLAYEELIDYKPELEKIIEAFLKQHGVKPRAEPTEEN